MPARKPERVSTRQWPRTSYSPKRSLGWLQLRASSGAMQKYPPPPPQCRIHAPAVTSPPICGDQGLLLRRSRQPEQQSGAGGRSGDKAEPLVAAVDVVTRRSVRRQKLCVCSAPRRCRASSCPAARSQTIATTPRAVKACAGSMPAAPHRRIAILRWRGQVVSVGSPQR